MSVVVAMSTTALLLAALAAIAQGRMRAHRLGGEILSVRGVLLAVSVLLGRGWLAWCGVDGMETSAALAIAAVAAITDLECGYVFDRVLLAGGAGLVAIAVANERLWIDLAGGTVGALLLLAPWAVTRARGMGLGDVKLGAVLGFALGPYGTLRAFWFAFVIGAVVSVAYVATRRSRSRTLPFAPFLGLGALISFGSAAL